MRLMTWPPTMLDSTMAIIMGAMTVPLWAADVPMIYISVSIWRTIHPKTTVVPTLDPGMRPPFWLSMITFMFLFFILMGMRRRLERLRTRYDALYLAAQDAGLIED